MLYTSGTTGRPKGVRKKPHPPAVDNLAGYEAHSVHLCTGPLYHAAPLNISLISPLSNGAGVVVMDGWTALETLRLVEEHRDAHPHGADDVPPPARARRRDARPVRPLVVAARGARRRAVPDPGEAGHDRVVRAGARRVLRVDRRRGNARRRRHLAAQAGHGRQAVPRRPDHRGRRGRAAAPGRRDRDGLGQEPPGRGVRVLPRPGEDRPQPARRLVHARRRRLPRRGRLPLPLRAAAPSSSSRAA